MAIRTPFEAAEYADRISRTQRRMTDAGFDFLQTMSLRAGDTTPLQAGMTFHVMIGMWLDGGGYSISETILITESGAECLASIPRTAATYIDVNGASYVR